MDKHPQRIAGMFDAIARRYDLLNHVLSAGLDVWWRRRAVRALALTGRDVVLDVCTGTCDFALSALRSGAARPRRVLGLDFSGEMLKVGHEKLRAARVDAIVPLVRGDAMHLPVASGAVDAITIGFGIRNVMEPPVALREFARVLGPAGRVAVLEFALPRTPVVRGLYLWYFRHVLPRIGRLVSRHTEAYTYLPASVGSFYEPEQFCGLLRAAGFGSVRAVRMSLGIVYLYVARKADSPAR